ncbi:MAG: SGNH/GDSL hydrolase family protein [Balneolaceae bacterium]|nr:SGNH/GDSL hydrolase family protein [Balneolaceae bacterium]
MWKIGLNPEGNLRYIDKLLPILRFDPQLQFMKLTILFILSLFGLLFLPAGQMYAQTESGDLSTEQMAVEYERWSAIRDDWPNLNRFKEENLTLGPPREGERRVVFMGNSITQGWSEHYPEYFEGKSYINRGISGQTTPQMLVRFRQDVISLQPGVVVILAGTNDIAGNTGPSTIEMIAGNLFSMAELAKANGIRVILSSVLPVYEYPWRPGQQPAGKIIRLNELIKEFAVEHGIYYLDYFSSVVDENNGMQESLAFDGVHPNREGYMLMSELAEEAIQFILEKNDQ